MQGFFGQRGELYFEIDLIAVDGSVITVNALIDTGFTDWLAMNSQDAEDLGWSILGKREMLTARGDALFNLYEGTVVWEGQERLPNIESSSSADFPTSGDRFSRYNSYSSSWD